MERGGGVLGAAQVTQSPNIGLLNTLPAPSLATF
jgi:hypothetical protein